MLKMLSNRHINSQMVIKNMTQMSKQAVKSFYPLVKFFFIFFIYGYSFLLTAQDLTRRTHLPYYDEVVSLGGHCQVAHQLKVHNLRYHAYPFDYVITPYEGLAPFLVYQGFIF